MIKRIKTEQTIYRLEATQSVEYGHKSSQSQKKLKKPFICRVMPAAFSNVNVITCSEFMPTGTTLLLQG
jgi:hypothetical protein